MLRLNIWSERTTLLHIHVYLYALQLVNECFVFLFDCLLLIFEILLFLPSRRWLYLLFSSNLISPSHDLSLPHSNFPFLLLPVCLRVFVWLCLSVCLCLHGCVCARVWLPARTCMWSYLCAWIHMITITECLKQLPSCQTLPPSPRHQSGAPPSHQWFFTFSYSCSPDRQDSQHTNSP